MATEQKEKKVQPLAPPLTDEEREQLKKIKLNEDEVAELLKTMPIWDVAEKVYGREFDHSDRRTWIFYQKVNRIRHKRGLPRIVPGK